MPSMETPHFGVVDYSADNVVEFPNGIPAFESETRFLAMERPETAPVVFLQSLGRPGLVFMTLPVNLVEPGYRSELGAEDLEAIGFAPGSQPVEGAETLTLAVITVDEDRVATANLLAPIVISLLSRRGVQAVQSESSYSARHPLPHGCGE